MYLEQNAITFDNIMDTLLYSDSKNCTIIKAAVMDNLVRLSDTAFVQQLSFKGIPGHLMKDLLTAAVRMLGGLAVLARETSENVAKNTRDKTNRAERLSWQAQHDVQVAEHSAQIAKNSARIAENEETLARVEATQAKSDATLTETQARQLKTDNKLAQLKKEVRKFRSNMKLKYKQQEAEARAKYRKAIRKAIVLSFFVGLLSAVTIEYVFACIMDYM